MNCLTEDDKSDIVALLKIRKKMVENEFPVPTNKFLLEHFDKLIKKVEDLKTCNGENSD